ncbi:unnamed protein product, partial [marine sediment metagenome]
MVSEKPSFISLFAGCGGSSLGYKQAGFHELLAIDFDKHAIEIFKLNFPNIPCWQRDIKEVTGKEIMDFCRIKKGELDLLDASPPCQGFSTAGKRQINDERNDLFKEFVRLIKELEPKVFVMENVSGLIKGKMKGRFIEIMRELKSLSYQVKCKLMNAMYYGVPQSRQRLIWIGAKEIIPSFPKHIGFPISAGEALNIEGVFYDSYPKQPKTNRPAPTLRQGRSYSIIQTRSMGINPRMNGPAACITKSSSDYQAKIDNKTRRLTIAEAKILSSYPEGFNFEG